MGSANVGSRLVLCEHFAAGGTLDGRDPAPMRREGEAMLLALLEDLAALGFPALAAVVRPELRPTLPAGVAPLPGGPDPATALARALADGGGRCWPVGPETGGVLTRLARAADRAGDGIVGTPAAGVRAAARRSRLLARLARAGVKVPATLPAPTARAARRAARELGGRVVVKPGRGAGGAGVRPVDGGAGLEAAHRAARSVEPDLPPLVQRHVGGTAASATLLVSRGAARPLALNRQVVRFTPGARYEGGVTPLRHPDADRALRAAADAVRACGGLRGLVGVDLVLGPDGPVVLEVNPRLTTSYLGLRRHVGPAAAAAALRASGHPVPDGAAPPLPDAPVEGEPVRFRPDGRTPARPSPAEGDARRGDLRSGAPGPRAP